MKSTVVDRHLFSTASEFLEKLAHCLEVYDCREAFLCGHGGEFFNQFEIVETQLEDGSVVHDVILIEKGLQA